jgi:hypothetical protein
MSARREEKRGGFAKLATNSMSRSLWSHGLIATFLLRFHILMPTKKSLQVRSLIYLPLPSLATVIS